MSGFSKNLGSMGIHAFQIAFFRSVFGLLALLPFILGKNGAPLSTGRPFLYFLRCGIGITSLMSLFYSMTALPLATAAALSFTRPLFLVLLAILFLGELVGWRRGSGNHNRVWRRDRAAASRGLPRRRTSAFPWTVRWRRSMRPSRWPWSCCW